MSVDERPVWVVDVQPNRWYHDYNGEWKYWAGEKFVVLAKFANGWHVGFTNDPLARHDYYWASGVSEEAARKRFEMARVA